MGANTIRREGGRGGEGVHKRGDGKGGREGDVELMLLVMSMRVGVKYNGVRQMA